LSLSEQEQLPPSADVSQATIAACGRVWYQPIVSQAGVLQGVEALARWQLPDGELLLPDEFLPVLEFAGMEEAFTWHVLEQALGLANQVMGESGRVLPVAVNIPGRMLEREHFPQVLQGLLQLHGVPAHSLTLELVETSTLKTDSAHVTGLLRLRMLGCQLSIGDFGMGGTSLQHLLELPFTELKIPPAFACGMANDDRKAAVVACAMSMAARLDVAVVVTGVETAADYHAVGELGAAWLQGCFIARPMEAETLKQWIAFQARPARVPARK
ncbi:MAG: EAL domain-containing protein, partial [Pseudomonas paracarnis]